MPDPLSNGKSKLAREAGVNLDTQVYELGIQGFAAKQNSPDEVWGDLFMTAILHPVDENDEVYDIFTVGNSANLPTESGEFYDCEENLEGCDDEVIGWQFPNIIAGNLRDYMDNQLFSELFDRGM